MRRVAAVFALAGLLGSPAYALRRDEGSVVARPPAPRALQAAEARKPTAEQSLAAARAKESGVEVSWREQADLPVSVRGVDLGKRRAFSGGKGLQVKGGGAFQEDAVAVLDNLSPLFRIREASSEFAARRTDSDALGFRHVRMTQKHQGLRVVGRELVVHFDKEGAAYEVNGQYEPDLALDVTPKITASDALRAAREDLVALGKSQGSPAGRPELVVFARGTDPTLAYELTLSSEGGAAVPERWRYWINALSGAVLQRYNDIKHIAAPANGVPTPVTGNLLPREGGEVKTVSGWRENTGTYYLYNRAQMWRVRNAAPNGYTDANTYAYRATSDWGESDPAESSAAYNVDLIQRYYEQVHNRRSYDGAGTLADAYVHQLDGGQPMANAFWDGTAMRIGDGDGETADNLGVLDVFAHEYTHAVTDRTADLVYADESGALNESFSDIFGACVEFHYQQDDRATYPNANPGVADWLMGEDCWIGSTALRDLRSPSNTDTVGLGNEQPSRYKGSYWYSGAMDNGGVHINSGAHNFFFYLLCDGGEGVNDGLAYKVTGIGVTNAEQLAYRVLTVYCTPDTDFRDVRAAWVSAARDLNTNWVREVKLAWKAIIPVPPPVIYTATGLPDGRVGSPYSYALGAAGGDVPYVWQMVSGELPPTLTMSNAGVISGMPELAGTYEFKVALTDYIGLSVTNDFSLTIVPPYGAPFQETFESAGVLPEGWTQQYVTNTVPWTFRSGSVLSHPPSAHAGGYNACLATTFTNRTVTRLVSPRIDFGVSPRAAQLTFWHFMEAYNGDQDHLRVYYKTGVDQPWNLLATYKSSVPQWRQQTVTLPEPNQTYYIAFEGTPRYGYGIYIDDVYVCDPTPPFEFTSTSELPDAIIKVPYIQTLTAQGGRTPYTFTLESGALPPGIALYPDGVVSGQCDTVEHSAFDVRLTDNDGNSVVAPYELSVTMPRVSLLYEPFEQSGVMPSRWSQEYATGAATWRCQSGGGDVDLFHQPSSAHGGIFNAILYSPSYDDSVTRLVTQVNLGPAPSNVRLEFWHAMPMLDDDQDELRLYYKTSAAGVWLPITNGVFTANTPTWTYRRLTLPNPASTYYLAFEGTAHYGYGVCLDDIRISIESSAPFITTSSLLPSGTIGIPYQQTLTASGGVEPYTWSVVSNALPTGLTLSGAVISGTPTVAETKVFRIRVQGNDGYASTNTIALQVRAARSLPFVETFESGVSMPAGWTQEYVFKTANWIFRNGSPSSSNERKPVSAHGGTNNACLFFPNNTDNHMTKLISPMLNLGNNTPNTKLSFWQCRADYYSDLDQLRVYYRTNGIGAAWVLLAEYKTAMNAWTNIVLNLPNPSPTYYIAFEGNAKYGHGVCLDDISVTGNISPYQTWKSNHFTADELMVGTGTGDEDDFDGDGIANGLEYAMGLDPRVPSLDGAPFGGVFSGYLTLTHRENKEATDVTYAVEACTSLVENAWSTTGVSQVSRDDSNAWWSVTSRHDTPVNLAPQRFLRLKVQLPAP